MAQLLGHLSAGAAQALCFFLELLTDRMIIRHDHRQITHDDVVLRYMDEPQGKLEFFCQSRSDVRSSHGGLGKISATEDLHGGW